MDYYETEPDELRTGAPRWLPFGAAGAVLAAVLVAGLTGGGDDTNAAAVPTSASTAGSTAPVVTNANPIVVASTDSPIVKTPLDRTLTKGLGGKDVVTVQKRLKDLGFDPGKADGAYGTQTIQSVWAFEKLILGVPRSQATGTVTPEMWSRMQDPIEVKPRRPSGGANHVEIYLPEQVMVVFHADKAVLITHVSSGELDADGKPAEYREKVTYDTDANGNPLPEPVTKDIVGWAKTPAGVFKAYRFVSGTRNGPLGSMWDPIYINYGIAIHGALKVPLEPASHGCIRVPLHISPYLQTLIGMNDRVLIWDGIKEPEQQTKADMLPIWDQPDPLATTTTTLPVTSSTSSTSSTSTTQPTGTTKAPTTTAKPPVTPAPTTTHPPTTTVAPTTTHPPTTTTHPPTTTTRPPAPTTVAPPTTARP